MTRHREPISSVIIVGGGTAGWMTAASLSHRLAAQNIAITVIESSAIGTVGVGEATVPAIRQYFASLGLDTFDLMKATNATFKLAIDFDGWRTQGHSFFHPFGRYGIAAGPVSFHHLWHKLAQAGHTELLGDYCLANELCRQGRFALPDPQPPADFATYDWAIHFDAGLFARYLRSFAEARGVTRIDARITTVSQDSEDGFITSVTLEDSRTITGDLYIDCSGFRGLLIRDALKVPCNDWRHWLPCDRAVALPCEHANANDIAPYTRARAETAGWTWRIPLQHRVGNGYVYSSDHISDDDAESHLRSTLEGEPLAAANRLRFTAGHMSRLWDRNCVAIGLSGGFLEPLESTSITLIQAGIAKLLTFFPDRSCDPALAAEYNRISAIEYERIRDFIILHYWGNQRGDEALWRYCRDMPLPDSLAHRIALFRASGKIAQMEWESFFEPSWLCLLDGLDIAMEAHDPFADAFAVSDIAELARNIRADVKSMAQAAERHDQSLRKHCLAE